MNKTLNMLGLCTRARACVHGASLSCDAVRTGRAVLVCLCADASAGTRKKISNCCSYYGVELLEIDVIGEQLGKSCGKAGALSAVAVTDTNFAKAIKDSVTVIGR